MPSMDRHWRWIYGFAVIGLVLAVLMLVSAGIVGVMEGTTPLSMFSSITLSEVMYIVIFLGFAWWIYSYAGRTHHRLRQRARARG